MSAAAIVLASSPLASGAVVFSTDFESGSPAEISGAGEVTGTQGFSDFGFGNNYFRNSSASQPTLLTLGGLGAHSHVSLSFSLAILDSWDGFGGLYGEDFLGIEIDGVPVFSESFDMGGGTASNTLTPLNSPGHYAVSPNWGDNGYVLTFVVPHTSSNLTVSWQAYGPVWQGGDDESFAIDNIRVETRGQTNGVPDGGSAVLMLGLSLLGLSGVRKSFRR